MHAPTASAAALLLLASAACSSSSQNAASSDGGPATPEDAYVAPLFDADVCNNHGMEVDTYYPGISKAGTSGDFTFILVSADPTPPSDPRENTWTFKVVDKSGQPVKDATLSLPTTPQWTFPQNPWMPFMRHGAPVPPTVKSNGDGTGTVTIDFNMSQYWQTHICAQSGSTTDCATFSFCLP